MGAVKDLVDLVTQLSESIEDRKFAAELREIQRMIGGIQSEHAELHEKRIELMTENAELKQIIGALKEEIAELKQEIVNVKISSSKQVDELHEEAQKILLVLTKQKRVNANQIAHMISLDLTRTEYWLNILCRKKMLYNSITLNSPTTFSLAQAGREYLILKELI